MNSNDGTIGQDLNVCELVCAIATIFGDAAEPTGLAFGTMTVSAGARRYEELALRRRKLANGLLRREKKGKDSAKPWPRATQPARPPSDAAGSAEVEAEAARELSLRGRRILAASFGKHPGTPPRRVPLTRRESDSSAEGAARVYPERPVRLSSRG